ncbi:MAG TPA: enolase C-terminal domain-like protein [Geminicoccaceae bacterium]|nr:enolase C-terminal domain-like protein [Geminicoccaceae bacterium]
MSDGHARLAQITLHRVRLPLRRPYHVSYRVYEDFEPIVVEVRDGDGRIGWGEGHISPGYSHETVDGGWDFCRAQAERVLGLAVAEAKAVLLAGIDASPVATTALVTALEMLEGSSLLRLDAAARIPLLTPLHGTAEAAIGAEVEERLQEGFRTFKVKVGKDVRADLERVGVVQRALAGRAAIRLDANRGFGREDGCRFAAALDPAGIELFEQPCAADDWAANAAVAEVSTVPVMLDESVYGMADIERAAGLEGVGLVKLKLKKLGSLERLQRGLERIRELGMEPVLGDGVAADIGCWMEACIARSTIRNAGEMNGFLKPRARLFAEPLRFADGALHLDPGFVPAIDRAALAAHTLTVAHFAAPRIAVASA